MNPKDMYLHYKGGFYECVGVATHTETNEEMMVYKNQSNKIFVRPLSMFFEKIKINDELIDRFKKI
jgi:hypothetical protein